MNTKEAVAYAEMVSIFMLGHRAWDTKYIQTLDPPHDEYYMDQAFREFIGDEYARMLEYIRRFAIATINIPNQMFTPETNSISEWYRRPYDMRKAPSEPDVISVDKITTDFVERRIIHYAITEDNPSYIVCQFFDQHPCDARSADEWIDNLDQIDKEYIALMGIHLFMLDIKKQAHDMLQIAMDTSDSVTAVQYAYTKSIIDTHESSHLQFSTHNNPFTTHVNMHVGIDVLQKIIRIDNDIHTNDFKILSHIDCSCRLELIVAIYTDPNRVLDKCATEFCMVMDLAVREIRTTYRCAILALSRYAGIHEYLRDYLIAWF